MKKIANLIRAATMLTVLLVVVTPVGIAGRALADQQGDPGAVFVQSNDIVQNAIFAYARSADGSLTLVGRYPTLGRGGTEVGAPTDPLSSQGSLTYDARHRRLYAVNAGSDTLSVFAVDGTSLHLLQVIASGGHFPTSVAVHGALVYVLNAGGDGTISGFRSRDDGLTPIAGSVRSLALGNATPPFFLTSPGQIGFTTDGTHLLIPTKVNGAVDTFALGPDGQPASAPVITATGPAPFPFVSDERGRVVLIDASGSANTYDVSTSGALVRIGAPVANGQNGTCWVARAHGYIYATNTGSNTITGWAEAPGGQLTLLHGAVSATTDAGPIDIAASPDGRQLFELNGLSGDLGVYSVAADGTLTHTATVHGLPAFNGSNGMEGIAVT